MARFLHENENIGHLDGQAEFLDDIGFEWINGQSTIYTVASQIVYGQMLSQVNDEIGNIIEQMKEEAA